MHPAIQIFCYIVTAVSLIAKPDWLLFVVVAGSCCLILFAGKLSFRPFLRFVWRLRWFWLSLMILYFWFTPGRQLFSSLGSWSPSIEGLEQGAVRIGMMLVLLFAVSVLLGFNRRPELFLGLMVLLKPLDRFNRFAQRFALLVTMVIERLEKVEAICRAQPFRREAGESRIAMLSRVMSAVFDRIVGQAMEEPEHEVSLPVMVMPRWFEWFYPLLLVSALWGITRLSL